MSTSTPPTPLPAQWFDGRTSRARPVRVLLTPAPGGPTLTLHALNGERETRRFAHAQVGWPERWSAAKAPPRVAVDLGAHGSLQIEDVAGWQAALQLAGRNAPLAERMQTRWPVLLAVLLVAGAGIGAFYRWGTPWAATQLTRKVPLSWELNLTEQALKEIDARYTKPTNLPPARQAELRAGFARLSALVGPCLQRYPGYAPPLKLEFRSGMPANAFALPGGTIVMTDAMVEQAGALPGTGDAALLGVLAHEIGHVQHRHTTRMVVEQGVLNIGLGLALGDVSSIVSTGASLLTGLSYRRSHETESDCYAVAMMGKAGLPTAPMADLLLGIEDAMAPKTPDAPPAGKASAAASTDVEAKTPPARERSADWFSTHPDTVARAERLKAGQTPDCAPLPR